MVARVNDEDSDIFGIGKLAASLGAIKLGHATVMHVISLELSKLRSLTEAHGLTFAPIKEIVSVAYQLSKSETMAGADRELVERLRDAVSAVVAINSAMMEHIAHLNSELDAVQANSN